MVDDSNASDTIDIIFDLLQINLLDKSLARARFLQVVREVLLMLLMDFSGNGIENLIVKHFSVHLVVYNQKVNAKRCEMVVRKTETMHEVVVKDGLSKNEVMKGV